MTFPSSQPRATGPGHPRATGSSRRGVVLLVLSILVPLVVFAALFLIPATRGVVSGHVGLASGLLTVVLLGSMVLGFRALARQQRAQDEGTAHERGAWASARGWQYRSQPRQVPPDALTEVDPRLHPEPITVRHEASGTFRGRAALVQSRDTWVRVRTAIAPSRREVVGIQSGIDLPQVLIETGLARAGAVATLPNRAQIAVFRQTVGLSRVPLATGAVLWTPPGLEQRITEIVQPVLHAHARELTAERTIVACTGRWVLVSARSDPSPAAAERRLHMVTALASSLEAGAEV